MEKSTTKKLNVQVLHPIFWLGVFFIKYGTHLMRKFGFKIRLEEK